MENGVFPYLELKMALLKNEVELEQKLNVAFKMKNGVRMEMHW